MPSRSLCIVVLIVLVGQMTLAGAMSVPPLAAVHPAWLLQDRLVFRIYEAANRLIPFNFRSPRTRPQKKVRRRRKRTWPPWRMGSGSQSLDRRTVEGQGVNRQRVQPPNRWPEHLLDLMDESACRRVIRAARWEHGRVCPHCGSPDIEVLVGQFTSAGWQRYACQVCRTPRGHPKSFSDLTGTPWESSHLSPAQLLVSLSAFVEGHSAEELACQTGVQPRIGQRMRRLYQVVLHLNRPDVPLDADIEIDEIYIISGWKGRPAGHKPPRPPRRRRLKGKRGRGTWETDKVPLVAIVQRNGQVRLFAQRNLQKRTFRPLLKRWVQRGATVHTDEYDIYHFLEAAGYAHRVVTHGAGEYARGDVHINTTEAVFSLLRPYLATFRGVSKVYLPLYVAAFEFRHNHRYLTKWEQAGILIRLLCQTDGPTVRQALRDNKVVELCDLPT